MNKAPTWATRLEQAWTRVSHLQARYPSKLSHVSGYDPTRFGLGETGCTNKAQGTAYFQTSYNNVFLSRATFPLHPLFHRWEQLNTLLRKLGRQVTAHRKVYAPYCSQAPKQLGLLIYYISRFLDIKYTHFHCELAKRIIFC
jgi:hypothetical protein